MKKRHLNPAIVPFVKELLASVAYAGLVLNAVEYWTR